LRRLAIGVRQLPRIPRVFKVIHDKVRIRSQLDVPPIQSWRAHDWRVNLGPSRHLQGTTKPVRTATLAAARASRHTPKPPANPIVRTATVAAAQGTPAQGSAREPTTKLHTASADPLIGRARP